ncbi:MAG: hypothetical protein KDM63_18240, partial [Verrucomicrobiae bacterium]|nr:hypothetical protein [Verrucomicrobiae bacterium]
MTRFRLLPFLLCCILCGSPGIQAQAPLDAKSIDWDKAKALYQRERAGETLSPDDNAYLQQAKELRRTQSRPRDPASPQSRGQRTAPERLIPLTDLEKGGTYENQDGGLYGNGSNEPPD